MQTRFNVLIGDSLAVNLLNNSIVDLTKDVQEIIDLTNNEVFRPTNYN